MQYNLELTVILLYPAADQPFLLCMEGKILPTHKRKKLVWFHTHADYCTAHITS